MINRKDLLVAISAGIVLFVVAAIRPVHYAAETTFFVPLTLLEKQIAQNGIGLWIAHGSGCTHRTDAKSAYCEDPRGPIFL